MNVCMSAKHQKREALDQKMAACSVHKPWKNNSCCTAKHQPGCSTAGRPTCTTSPGNHSRCHGRGRMSADTSSRETPACMNAHPTFRGAWINQVDSSWRRERILNVPLCKEDCETWWQDCKDQMTCKENWHKGWDWSSGTNECPHGSPCRPWILVFPQPKDLCEKIWTNSYQYTTFPRGSGRCIQMWFDPNDGNPNEAVAKYYSRAGKDLAACLPLALLFPVLLAVQ
uniref:Uncharacterized protein n=1 Tax=Sphaerodactylus townsendi TaxID=933632 RepID=A0ACB8FF23_9SAUR